MSRSSQFFGGVRPPTSIINRHSGGGASNGVTQGNSLQILSGALTAATYKQVLTVTGGGIISILSAATMDTTSRTIGLKVVIDGVTVFDATTNSLTLTAMGIVAVGGMDLTIVNPEEVPFNVSLAVWIKSSLSETDKIGTYITYRTI